MTTTLTSKGQITIPRYIREFMQLEPGSQVDFTVNGKGEVVITKVNGPRRRSSDRLERARGKAGIKWRTDELLSLLRSEG